MGNRGGLHLKVATCAQTCCLPGLTNKKPLKYCFTTVRLETYVQSRMAPVPID